MSTLGELIIQAEWQMFDKVVNIGGRASCQDERKTFFSMRNAQLSSWDDDTRASYLMDILLAIKDGRNLLSEKYAYMMKHTSPLEYERIKTLIPQVSSEIDMLVNEIAAELVVQQEDLVLKYPSLKNNARPVRSSEDYIATSFETYLKGELYTYSIKTLTSYKQNLFSLKSSGQSMAEIILLATVNPK